MNMVINIDKFVFIFTFVDNDTFHYCFQVDLAYKSIDSNTYDIKITPFLTEYHIAEVSDACPVML